MTEESRVRGRSKTWKRAPGQRKGAPSQGRRRVRDGGQLQALGACLSRLTACSFFLAALANSDRSKLWMTEGEGNGEEGRGQT